MGDIHLKRNERTIQSLLKRIRGIPVKKGPRDFMPIFMEPVPEPNRSLLIGFYHSLVTEDISVGRQCVLLGNMYRISIWLKHKPVVDLTRSELIDLVEYIKNLRESRRSLQAVGKPYASQTVESYKITLKKFWRWLKNPELAPDVLRGMPYPPEVNWIHRKKKKNDLLPKDLWTPEEVTKIAALANNERDRAFILALFGSGCRIGEFLPLRRDDIAFDDYSAQILVNGKTGSRRIRLTPAASVALAAWLDTHPNKERGAPVWIDIQMRNAIPTEHLSYDWAREMLKHLARRAGVDKPLHPHLMRHSLATYYAPRLTEAVMNEHFGWRQGGRTAATYTHLSGKQVDDQILAIFGKKKVDASTTNVIDSTACLRCGLSNAPTSIQCGKCGFALTDEAARQLHERRDKADQLMDSLLSNPEVIKVLGDILRRPKHGR